MNKTIILFLILFVCGSASADFSVGLSLDSLQLIRKNWTGINDGGFSGTGPSGGYRNALNPGICFSYSANRIRLILAERYGEILLEEQSGCVRLPSAELQSFESLLGAVCRIRSWKLSGVGVSGGVLYRRLSLEYGSQRYSGNSFGCFSGLDFDFTIAKSSILTPYIYFDYYPDRIAWNKSFRFNIRKDANIPLSGIRIGMRVQTGIAGP